MVKNPALHMRIRQASLDEIQKLNEKKRPHKAGAKLLRQVSYRQETYRAVTSLYA
jgi:hypothetical protein